jgi:leader peptidase (prepilin peptidase)/N-methyltransferase
LGATAGSFFNCARYRLPRGISLNRPAFSYCESCGSRLTAVELIPIFSWLWLGGRCRRCRAPIGIGSLLIEGICAAAGTLAFLWFAGFL